LHEQRRVTHGTVTAKHSLAPNKENVVENLPPKKRKLVLNRETVIPLQREALGTVIGGEGNSSNGNLVSAVGESAGASGGASAVSGGVVSLVASESTSGCVGAGAAVSGAASAVTSAVDHVSQKLGLPCWVATSLGGASIHFTRKW
jgi:hypothetical protein